MGRLFITLAVITSTLFTSQIPKNFDTDSAEESINRFQSKKDFLSSRTMDRSTRHDVNDQKYFNGNRWYLMNKL